MMLLVYRNGTVLRLPEPKEKIKNQKSNEEEELTDKKEKGPSVPRVG